MQSSNCQYLCVKFFRVFPKKNELLRKEKLIFSLVCSRTSVAQPKYAIGNKGRQDQPKRRSRNNAVRDNRASRSRTREYRGHKVEIEQAVQAPVHSPDNHKNIRNYVDNSHSFPSYP